MVFVQKSNFFSFGFFWCNQVREKPFFIFLIEKMILDQKINVLKGAKK